MANHTPGPWEMFYWDDNGTPVVGVKPGNKGDVADCSINNYRPLDELKANARLIAAAPDLLEAIIDIVCAHDPYSSGGLWSDHLAKAKNAIAKATGETE